MNEFVMKETTGIQFESLMVFMSHLTFEYDEINHVFVSNERGMKAVQKISAATAVRLHNLPAEHWESHNGAYTPGQGVLTGTFFINKYLLNQIQAAKLVTRVKLQGSKRGWVIQGQMVKFTDPDYAQYYSL